MWPCGPSIVTQRTCSLLCSLWKPWILYWKYAYTTSPTQQYKTVQSLLKITHNAQGSPGYRSCHHDEKVSSHSLSLSTAKHIPLTVKHESRTPAKTKQNFLHMVHKTINSVFTAVLSRFILWKWEPAKKNWQNHSATALAWIQQRLFVCVFLLMAQDSTWVNRQNSKAKQRPYKRLYKC